MSESGPDVVRLETGTDSLTLSPNPTGRLVFWAGHRGWSLGWSFWAPLGWTGHMDRMTSDRLFASFTARFDFWSENF